MTINIMIPVDHGQAIATAATPSKAPKYRTPPGKRVIHVLVPEATFVRVHKMALESGLRFSHYLARFLDEAFPHPPASGKVGTPLMGTCSSTIQLIRTIQ